MIGHLMSETSSSKPETNDSSHDIQVVNQSKKRSRFSRFGCGLLLVVWFTLLLTPCALFYLAANGEIRIWHSDIPEPHSHPRLLIELITEVDYRGLRLVNSSVVDTDLNDNSTCVQTNVSYLLWETVEDNQDVSFCDCYIRDDSNTNWMLSETISESCVTTSP